MVIYKRRPAAAEAVSRIVVMVVCLAVRKAMSRLFMRPDIRSGASLLTFLELSNYRFKVVPPAVGRPAVRKIIIGDR